MSVGGRTRGAGRGQGVGWSDLLKKNLDTCHVVLNCYGTPNPNFYFDLLLFNLAQGLRVPETIFPLLLKLAKTNLKNSQMFRVAPEAKSLPLFI